MKISKAFYEVLTDCFYDYEESIADLFYTDEAGKKDNAFMSEDDIMYAIEFLLALEDEIGSTQLADYEVVDTDLYEECFDLNGKSIFSVIRDWGEFENLNDIPPYVRANGYGKFVRLTWDDVLCLSADLISEAEEAYADEIAEKEEELYEEA